MDWTISLAERWRCESKQIGGLSVTNLDASGPDWTGLMWNRLQWSESARQRFQRIKTEEYAFTLN
jgi:hypothetical protein